MYLDSSVKLYSLWLLLTLVLAMPNLSQSATVEVRLNDSILANATVEDSVWNGTLTTDGAGLVSISNDCIFLRYLDENNNAFRSMETCGMNEADRVYRVNLRKEITLSGTVEYSDPRNALITFVNLDEGRSLPRGINWNTLSFSEKLPAGPYRIKVTRNTWPTPDGDYYISSVGVDAADGSVSGIKVGLEDSTTSRWPGKPPRADLITVRHSQNSHLSFVEGAPGAAEPLVRIGVVNLQTGQTFSGYSYSDGSFSIKFFAPPGAAVQVSQDRHSEGQSDFTSKQPSTVIHVPIDEPELSISTGQRLNGGSQNGMRELRFQGGKDPGVAWLTGTLDSADWQAGQTGTLGGSVDIYSRNLDFGAIPSLGGGAAFLELLFDAEGQQKAAQPQYSASDLTVTGMPIERAEAQSNEAIHIGDFSLTDYEQVGSGHGRASWSLDYSVPTGTPDGIYQLVLTGRGWSMNPWVTGLTSDRLFNEDVYGEPSFHLTETHGAARIKIGQVQSPRLYSVILLNDVSNGSRGTVSSTDAGKFGVAGHWITNADRLILPKSTRADGTVRKYNVEPFVPLNAFSNKEWLNSPKLPLDFPTGQLSATIISPDGTSLTVGPHAIKGALAQQATSEFGEQLVRNSNNPDMIYGLTTYSDDFDLTLDQYGEYLVSLEGSVTDIYGQSLEISGNYSIYIAELLDIETGVFPGTPFEVGDSYSPTVIVQPGVPAKVTVSLSHFPNSSESARIDKLFAGDANRFGYFTPSGEDFSFGEPGEYLANYTAEYTSPEGVLWMASRRWASIVETPNNRIITHGHRGEEADSETKQWYLMEDSRMQNAHFFSPYQIGDVMWMSNSTEWNAAMQNIVTLDDGDGTLTELINAQSVNRYGLDNGSLLLESGAGTQIPAFVDPVQNGVHWAYYYSSIGRPGVSVREFVGSQMTTNGYWRFNTPYGYQLGNGYEGDQPNDFKFVFGGAVYRVPDSNFSHYGAYGSLWTMLPDSDTDGGRVMPPFQGAAGGPSGGPLFELKGEQIDIFLHPQGVRPGTILEIGDVVSFSGQIAPTLPSKVQIEITAPSGAKRSFGGAANKIGYYFDPNNDYVVSEPGVHTVNVTVFHDGLTSAGQVEPPFPTGSVLGAENGSFKFYVTSDGAMQANLASSVPAKLPTSARLALELQSGDGSAPVDVQYTAVMPGFILNQATLTDASTTYDAFELNESFPNLDLPAGELQLRTGADTVTLSFLTQKTSSSGSSIYEGRQVLLQGEQILAPAHVKKLEGTFEVDLEESALSPGKRLTASVNFDAQGDADVYVAVFLPGGQFITLDQNLKLSNVGEVIPFMDSISLDDRSGLPLFDIPLDDSIDPGSYRLIVLLTSAGKDVLDDSYWLAFKETNFSFTK